MPLVQPATGTGSDPTPSKGLQFDLPPELVNEAATRLCWVSNLFAVTMIAIMLIQTQLQPEFKGVAGRLSLKIAWAMTFSLTVGFVFAHRFAWFSKIQLIRLGIVFEVAVAFHMSYFETALELHGADPVRGVSSLALWILLMGLLIPNTPAAKLLSSLACASMWPLAYSINVWANGYAVLPWNRLVLWMAPTLFAVVWAYLINRRLYRMHIENRKAQDLGSYQLDYMIGRGGMGEVWRARHQLLQRDAAVKIIRPEVLASQGGRQASAMRRRFEREARATASLRSPHTVALFDFGLARDNSFFYVMELLDGIDLQMLVERFGPPHPGRVAHILRQACDSLEEAHRSGLVHRDVKPTNIFVCRLGQSYDFTKVLDFGLVKNLMAESGATMTLDGHATGTPAYMAPEVAMGAENVDQRADIYGLGCVAYFLLTGQTVFNEPTPTALALAHVQKTPIAPSQRVETPIPRSIDQLVLQCLAKDPADRPRSAQEIARLLEAATDIPAWTRDDSVRWWTTNLPSGGGTVGARTASEPPTADSRLISAVHHG